MFASLAKPDDDAELHWLKVCITSLRKLFVFCFILARMWIIICIVLLSIIYSGFVLPWRWG